MRHLLKADEPKPENTSCNNLNMILNWRIKIKPEFWTQTNTTVPRLGPYRGARYITDFDGRYIFCTIFHEDSKNTIFFEIGHTQTMPKLCPAWLLIKTEQASQAEFGRRLGVSNLEKNCIFRILMKNCTRYVSASLIGQIFFKSGHP